MFFYVSMPVTVDAEPVVVRHAEPVSMVEIGDAMTLTKDDNADSFVVTYNGNPIDADTEPVVVTSPDGSVFTTSKFEADRITMPRTETDDEYNMRLCRQYAEAKPWLGVDCSIPGA